MQFEDGVDLFDEVWIETPRSQSPPPPWPPATTPAKLNSEVTAGIGDGRPPDLRDRRPPPEKVDIERPDFGAGYRAAVRANNSSLDYKRAAPAQPKNPPGRSDNDGGQPKRRLVSP